LLAELLLQMLAMVAELLDGATMGGYNSVMGMPAAPLARHAYSVSRSIRLIRARRQALPAAAAANVRH